MKILFFTKHELDWGSTKERIGNYIPYLEKRGHECHVISFVPNKLARMWIGRSTYPWLYQKIYSFYAGRFQRLLKSIRVLMWAKRYDLIVIQKINIPVWILKGLQRRQPRLVFDYDDLCFSNSSRPSLTAWWQNIQHPKVLKYYEQVISGNPYLKKYTEAYVPTSRAVLIPTAIDCDLYHPAPMKRMKADQITIGWIGSGENHYEHLKLLMAPLRTLGKHHKIKFVLVGAMGSKKIKGLFQDSTYEFECIDWLDIPMLAKTVRSFDIGLMPLHNDEGARSKCGFKALAYMASGVATVASPVGVNAHIVQDGANGFLASSEKEWVDKCSELITNQERRKRMSQLGRETVLDRYSSKRSADLFVTLLERA